MPISHNRLSRVGRGLLSFAALTVPGVGAVLPTAALSDVAIGYANGTAYPRQALYLGPTTLPAGDWVIHLAVKLPTSNAYGLPLLTLNPASTAAGWLAGNSNLALTFVPRTGGQALDPARGAILLSGKDDAGNWLAKNSNRSSAIYWGSAGNNNSVPYLAGPYMETPDGLPTSIFVQKVGGVVQLWIVQNGSTALLHDYIATDFGKMTASDGNIGWMPAANVMAPGVTYQRLFMAAGSLSAAQMEGIAQGVDPRQYLPFNVATDRLTNWTNATDASKPDLVGSGATGGFTFNGSEPTMSVQPALIPVGSVTAEMPRVALEHNSGIQHEPGSSSFRLAGRVTGADDDIYVQVVEFANKATIVKAWSKVATSFNGSWSGLVAGIPLQFKEFDLQVRKGTAGTVYTLNKSFVVGIGVDMWGQSISEKMRSTTNVTITGVAAGFIRLFSRAKSDSGSTQGITRRGWVKTDTGGYGEIHALRLIAEGAGCPVFGVVSAVEGSSIAAWDRTSSAGYIPAADSWQRTRPAHLFWQQWQGSTGVSPADYKAFLDRLLAQTRADFPWTWTFHMGPPNANGGAANLGTVAHNLRVAQSDWADTNAGARVVNVGALVDLKQPDTVHPGAEALGQGRIAERLARSVLFAEGIVATSARGPRPTSAARSGATVDVTFAHNGGTGLRPRLAEAISGFDVSVDNFANLLAISSAAVLNANTVRLTLAADPGGPVKVRYQWGNPGTATTPTDSDGLIPAAHNPVYDDRAPGMNTTLGFPAMFTTADLVTPS